MLPVVLTVSGPRLAGFIEGRLHGIDFTDGAVHRLDDGSVIGFANGDPAAVYMGVTMQVGFTGQLPVAAEKRVRPIKSRGEVFVPPEGFVSGYAQARPIIEAFRAQVPQLDAIRHSAVFAGMTIRTGIETAERAYACLVEKYKKAGAFPGVDELRVCIRSLGLPKMRETMYRHIQAWSFIVQHAIQRGLRDRELRRYLFLETEVPHGLSLAKLSFTLALLGQNLVCLDARLIGRMKIKDDWSDGNTKLNLARYERAEDAFLKGNPNYDAADPLGAARAQWISWEMSPVKGGVRPASHSVWLKVAAPLSQVRAALRVAPAPVNHRVAPPAPAERFDAFRQFAASFLAGVYYGDSSYAREFYDDPEASKIASGLRRIPAGILQGFEPRTVLGSGDYGTAAILNDYERVIKLTSDPTEVAAGAVLAGKELLHVARVFGSWYLSRTSVQARMGTRVKTMMVSGRPIEEEEEIRKKSRVGVLILEKVQANIPHHLIVKPEPLSKIVREFKLREGVRVEDLAKLTKKEARERLQYASEMLSLELENINNPIYWQIAEGLGELREHGVYAIDVHPGNVGYVGMIEEPGAYTIKIFDIGTSSSPDGVKVPALRVTVAPEAVAGEGVRVAELV